MDYTSYDAQKQCHFNPPSIKFEWNELLFCVLGVNNERSVNIFKGYFCVDYFEYLSIANVRNTILAQIQTV